MRRISVIFGMALTLILMSAAAAFGQAAGGIVIPVDTYIAADREEASPNRERANAP